MSRQVAMVVAVAVGVTGLALSAFLAGGRYTHMDRYRVLDRYTGAVWICIGTCRRVPDEPAAPQLSQFGEAVR